MTFWLKNICKRRYHLCYTDTDTRATLQRIGYEGVDCIQQVQVGAFVNMVMSLLFHEN